MAIDIKVLCRFEQEVHHFVFLTKRNKETMEAFPDTPLSNYRHAAAPPPQQGQEEISKLYYLAQNKDLRARLERANERLEAYSDSYKEVSEELKDVKDRNKELENCILELQNHSAANGEDSFAGERQKAEERISFLEQRIVEYRNKNELLVKRLNATTKECLNEKHKVTTLESRISLMLKGKDASTDQKGEPVDIMQESDDDSVDFRDGPNDRWTIQFKKLRCYRVEHGNCRVPSNYKKDPSLGKWVTNQKSAYNRVKQGKKGSPSITPERIEKLDSIGFYWGQKYDTGPKASFEEYLDQLLKFKEVVGNCNVPPTQGELGRFASRARAEFRLFKKGETALFSVEQFHELRKIGFSFKRPRKT